MVHRVFVGASAAATLPAALSAAILVGAPFAGTSVAPLAESHPVADATEQPETSVGTNFDIGPADWALIAGAEALVLGAAAGVALYARRRHGDERA
ncbi:MAG TPA: hypothetical protein VFJ98_04020 [Mycobacteriales bacterium]|jgi:hypothetical protein|nr:hypothetical protein [Mycobacteriales bacterium]